MTYRCSNFEVNKMNEINELFDLSVVKVKNEMKRKNTLSGL
jgi:hypothetical protein